MDLLFLIYIFIFFYLLGFLRGREKGASLSRKPYFKKDIAVTIIVAATMIEEVAIIVASLVVHWGMKISLKICIFFLDNATAIPRLNHQRTI